MKLATQPLGAGVGFLLLAASLTAVSAGASVLPSTSSAKCTITGTANPDRIDGTSGNDVIYGLGGKPFEGTQDEDARELHLSSILLCLEIKEGEALASPEDFR